MSRIIDLSYPVDTHWRPNWLNERKVQSSFDTGSNWYTSIVTINCHAFTHVDAPLHKVKGGKTLDQIPLDTFMGSAYIIDVSYKGPSEGIQAQDMEEHAQHLQAGGIAIIKTLWDEKCSHQSKEFWIKAPYIEKSACEWLLERKVKSVGFDFPPAYSFRYPYLDPSERGTDHYSPHETFLPKGIGTIEYLCNLGQLQKNVVQLFALYPNIVGVEGFPARVIAIED